MAKEPDGAIQIVELTELEGRPLKQYRTALEAAGKNSHSYAIDMYREVLRRHPGAMEVRQKLRECQLARIGGSSVWWRQLLAYFVVLPCWVKGEVLKGKKDYVGAFDNAEKAMTFDPTSAVCCTMLSTSAEAASFDDLVIVTLDWAKTHNPKNIRLLHQLGEAYTKNKEAKKAVECYQQILVVEPDRVEWKDALKNATAQAAMEDGWEDLEKGEGDYRTVIRDQDTTARLEQSERMVRTEEGIGKLIKAQLAECEATGSIDGWRKLAHLYREDNQFDKSLESYEKMVELAGALDPAIDKEMTGVLMQQYDQRIAALEDGSEDAAALKEEKDSILFDRLSKRVKATPTAYDDRLALAKLLYDRGNYDDALTHFQTLRKNPRYAVPATMFSGKCFAAKGVFDLARDQFQKVIDETVVMNKDKKQAYYELGHCHRETGDEESAMACYKAVYAVDVSFLDVRDIVESRES